MKLLTRDNLVIALLGLIMLFNFSLHRKMDSVKRHRNMPRITNMDNPVMKGRTQKFNKQRSNKISKPKVNKPKVR
jgi:hypothetical protein